ncbi:MAG TPA: response regulator [Anaerolineae bacterium]|nr:response regulator [Anaerolineae bacterium]
METKRHILVIDDDPDTRNLIIDALEPDYRVTPAAAPREALALCQAQCFDLALLDVILPEMSGLALLPRLRASDPRMVVVLMTVRTIVPDVVVAVRDYGAQDWLEKPFTLADRRVRVEGALTRLGNHRVVFLGDLALDLDASCPPAGQRDFGPVPPGVQPVALPGQPSSMIPALSNMYSTAVYLTLSVRHWRQQAS